MSRRIAGAGVQSTGHSARSQLASAAVDIGSLARRAARRARPDGGRARGARGAPDLRRAADGGDARRRAARLAAARRPATASRSRSRPAATSSSRCTPACSLRRRRCRSTRGWASASARTAPRRRARGRRPPLPGRRLAVRRRRAARGRRRARRPHLRHHRARRAPVELTSRNIEANALGSAVVLGTRPRRALAVPDAALARRRADGPAARGDLRPAPPCSSRRRRAHRAPARARRHHARLAGADHARRASSTPAAAPARGCARSCSAAARSRPRCSSAPPTRASRSPRPTASPRPARRSRSPSPATLETAGRPLPGVEARDRRRTARSSCRADRGGGVGRAAHRRPRAARRAQGRLTVIGRQARSTIVSGGENVAPAEVEAVLEEHPAVAEAGVFARPHPQWGEAVVALVVRATASRRRPPRSCATTASRGSPASRCRRRSSWWASSRARPLASCCAGSCA